MSTLVRFGTSLSPDMIRAVMDFNSIFLPVFIVCDCDLRSLIRLDCRVVAECSFQSESESHRWWGLHRGLPVTAAGLSACTTHHCSGVTNC